MTWLLDGNVLLALCTVRSPDRAAALEWFEREAKRFATCPSTQGTLLRNFGRVHGVTDLASAWDALEDFLEHPGHEFWADIIDYRAVAHERLQGGAQVTDAYLAALARHYQGRVATFDRAFAALHSDVVTKIGAP